MLQICLAAPRRSIDVTIVSIIVKTDYVSVTKIDRYIKVKKNSCTYLIVKLLELDITHGYLALLSRHILNQL